MPKATTCKLGNRIVSIEDALLLRAGAARWRRPVPEFSCHECNERVRPHKKATTGQAAHFEHRTRSPGCSQSA